MLATFGSVAKLRCSLKIDRENRNAMYSSSTYKPRASFLVQFPHVGKCKIENVQMPIEP